MSSIKNRVVLFALVIFLMPTWSTAQVLIVPDDIPSEAGIVIPYYMNDDMEGVEVDLGEAGEDQFWDFTGYVSGEILFDSLVVPAEAPLADSFPDANRVILTKTTVFGEFDEPSYQYETLNDSGWFMSGINVSLAEFGLDVDFPVIFREPPQLLPMPAEYGEEWAFLDTVNYIFAAPDSIPFADSIRIELIAGGSSSLDAWGSLAYPGGETDVLRQHIRLEGFANGYSITWLGAIRLELPLGELYRIDALHTYRWMAPGIGEIATVVSMPADTSADFELASLVRVGFVLPELVIEEDSLDFGNVEIGHIGYADLVVNNNGEGEGRILGVEIDSLYLDEITIAGGVPIDLPPGETTIIPIFWTPVEDRDLETVLLLYHNDPDLEHPYPIYVTGSAYVDNVEGETGSTPVSYSLEQNRPNPFNPVTTISFSLMDAGYAKINVYDILGRHVRNLAGSWMPVGQHEVEFRTENLANGIYFYILEVNDFKATKKMILLK